MTVQSQGAGTTIIGVPRCVETEGPECAVDTKVRDKHMTAPEMPQDRSETPLGANESDKDVGLSGSAAMEQPTTVFRAPATGGLPLHLANHIRQVAQKAIIRLPPDIKHSICKRCNAVLVDGLTSSKRTENLSKGGKKPWADVLVIECGACGAAKRFPVGAPRQEKKAERRKNALQRDDTLVETTQNGP